MATIGHMLVCWVGANRRVGRYCPQACVLGWGDPEGVLIGVWVRGRLKAFLLGCVACWALQVFPEGRRGRVAGEAHGEGAPGCAGFLRRLSAGLNIVRHVCYGFRGELQPL